MSVAKRIAVVAAVSLFLLAGAVVVVFALGKPTTAQPFRAATALAAVPDIGTVAPDAEADAGVTASDPLAIEIPGCVCHSDDPQLVAEHATRRMSQCFECHQGGMPEMGQ